MRKTRKAPKRATKHKRGGISRYGGNRPHRGQTHRKGGKKR